MNADTSNDKSAASAPFASVAIPTWKSTGIALLAAKDLPRLPDTEYVISWQKHDGQPIPRTLLDRDDISVHRFDGTGVSANRNNAIERCRGQVIIFADDDVAFDAVQMQSLLDHYRTRPGTQAVATATRMAGPRLFPAAPQRLAYPLPKGFWVTSFQLSFRADTGLRCCPEAGPGAPYYTNGDDELLLDTAIHRGLDVQYLPLVPMTHTHGPSSGSLPHTPGMMRSMGMLIALRHPLTWPLRILLKTWRTHRAGLAPLSYFAYIAAGALRAQAWRRRNRRWLW